MVYLIRFTTSSFSRLRVSESIRSMEWLDALFAYSVFGSVLTGLGVLSSIDVPPAVAGASLMVSFNNDFLGESKTRDLLIVLGAGVLNTSFAEVEARTSIFLRSLNSMTRKDLECLPSLS